MIKRFNSILLVDDDEINNILTKAVIEDLNITDEVRAFFDGEEALEYLSSYSGSQIALPVLILLDMNMPNMDGEEFLQKFNQLPFFDKDKIRIILLSALLPSKKYDYLKALGVEDFIEKPLTDDKINQLIKKLGFKLSR